MKEKEKIYWLGKEICDLTKDELIEIIEHLAPICTANTAELYELKKENFALFIDKQRLSLI